MNERIEKIKNHFDENKDRYLVGVCCTVVSGSIVFMIGRSETGTEIVQKSHKSVSEIV